MRREGRTITQEDQGDRSWKVMTGVTSVLYQGLDENWCIGGASWRRTELESSTEPTTSIWVITVLLHTKISEV